MKMSALLLVGLITVSNAIASPHHSDEDDRYTPLIRLLKQLRRRDRYQAYYQNDNQASNTDTTATSSAPVTSTSQQEQITTEFLGQRPQQQVVKNYNSNSFSSPDHIRKILAQSQQASGSSNSDSQSNLNLGDNGNIGGLIPNYQPNPSYSVTKVPAQRIEQINRGVSTILNGVGRASLDDILRGSFMFTRNENVRSVANTVLDSIFGRRNN